MKTTQIFQSLFLTTVSVLVMIGCTTAQKAQTMDGKTSNSAKSADGQTTSDSKNPESTALPSTSLAKYKDKKLSAAPTKPISPKYLIEHRTWLNDKIVTVSGIIVQVPQISNEGSDGVRSMANPQPRILIADSAKSSRDKNLDLMVIIDEEDRNYIVDQKITMKVRISSSKTAVILRKIS